MTVKNSLDSKIREVEEEHAGEVLDTRLLAHRQEERDRAMFILGGINIAGKVAASLDSEAIKALITFQERKLFESLGFETFVEFLEKSEHSPMSKHQFYERKGILEKEGEAVFDLLTDLGMSIRRRKLLGKGNVELQGDTLLVHDGGNTTSIAITDRASILDALASLADSNAEKAIKLERQKEKIDKHDEKVREVYAELDQVKAAKIADLAGNPHMIARVELGLAFRRLTETAFNLPAIEKDQFRDSALEDVAAWSSSLRHAYRTNGTEKPVEPTLVGDTFEEQFSNFFDTHVDLDAVGTNDSELSDRL